MIYVQLNEANFEYDIYSLIKAFFPREDLTIKAESLSCSEGISYLFIIEYNNDIINLELLAGTIGNELCHKMSKSIAVDYQNRSDTKNRLKRLLYDVLNELTGKTLPWGTLTGIRPTKISMAMIEAEKTDDEIASYMKSTYYTSNEKIKLCLDISHKELNVIEPLDYRNNYSLYIGIPFCPTTCLYCSFTSYPIKAYEDRVDRYLAALEKELRYVASTFPTNRPTSIYIGGGTPTSLDEDSLNRLLMMVDKYFDTSNLAEYTIEAGRPDSITEEKLSIIRSYPITRISINPQTMNDKTLKLIGRHHTSEDIKRVFGQARKLGFDNINMDLITGLPDETIEDVRYTMEEIKALAPDSLTVHSLALKRSSRLNIDHDAYEDYLIDNSQAHLDLVKEYALEMGLEPYYMYRQKNMAANLENIGYSSPKKEGIYNILIMEERQHIVACGAGTSSKYVFEDFSTDRCENIKDVDLYIEKIDEMIDRKKHLWAEYERNNN